jgi:predicted RNase H-like HicB family nuclease
LNLNYSISKQWSEEASKFIAHLPEFSPCAHIHGDTYANALENALEVLELLIEDYTTRHKPLLTQRTIKKFDSIAA